MYSRLIKIQGEKSFFLFGPRGTGKTTWLKQNFPQALYLDLLEAELFNDLTANPQRLQNLIPPSFKNWVILDEVQKIPTLLNEVHRLIENQNFKFILTGSSARKLRQKGVNLLAGRAITHHMYPLTALELGNDFSIKDSLQFGHLPSIFKEDDKKKYLESYAMTYLEEEIQQEGLTRQLAAFSRFLESASFSNGQVLNISEVARDCNVHRKVVENYFFILEDLMLSYRLPIFRRRAKRKLLRHNKFYFFDVGVYRTFRPSGPLDSTEEKEGVALENLVLQELKAVNDYLNLDYELFFWRTPTQKEVDFILYGSRGLLAIEVKRSGNVKPRDLKGLKSFLSDYPEAKPYLLYGNSKEQWIDGVHCMPIEKFLKEMDLYL